MKNKGIFVVLGLGGLVLKMLITLKFFCKLHRGISCFIVRKSGDRHGHLFSLPHAQQAWPFRNYQSMGEGKCQSLEINVEISFWPHPFPSALGCLLFRYLLPDCSLCSWKFLDAPLRTSYHVNWAGGVRLTAK